MTQKDCLAAMQRLRALERGVAAITQQPCAATFEWQCILDAMGWEIRGLRYVLSLEDRTLLDSVELLLEMQPVPAVYRDCQVAIAVQPTMDVPNKTAAATPICLASSTRIH